MSVATITARISYAKWLDLYHDEKPFLLLYDIPEDHEDQRTTNIVFEQVEKQVRDIRGSEPEFSLDQHGFKIVRHQTKTEHFSDRKIVDETYLPEIEQLLREEVEGVDRVFFFDWRVRDSKDMERQKSNTERDSGTGVVNTEDSGTADEELLDLNDYTTFLYPATYCHIDQSPAAVLSRVRLQMGDEAEKLLRGRVRIINVWRPFGNEVEEYPLAVCDASTASEDDFFEADHVRRHYVGATYYGINNEDHQWYYLSRQRPNEVLMMKIFDSEQNVKAKSCPHAAIKLPSVMPNVRSRKSIELRALVFTHVED